MNDRLLTILSVIVFIGVVGAMSWHDMHPSQLVAPKNMAPVISSYYAGEKIAFKDIPDDNLSVVVLAGRFSYAADGKMTFTPKGMPPASFAQRQVHILLQFDGMPKDPAKTIDQIQSVAKDWNNAGNDVNAIFMDYRPKNPDFKAYAALINGFKNDYNANPYKRINYNLAPLVNLSWLNDSMKPGLKSIEEKSAFFLIDLRPQDVTPETAKKLENAGYRYDLRLTAGALPSDIASGKEVLSSIGRYMVTLTPGVVIPKKEEKIGIFPKF